MSARFPKDFLDRLYALTGGGAPRRGAHTSGERAGDLGRGPEFVEHRAYQPGDDLSQIDWQVFARTAKPFLKMQRQMQSRRVGLLIDLSRSMAFGDPSKVDRALRAAVAIGVAEVTRGSEAAFVALGMRSQPAMAVLPRLTQARACLNALETWDARGDEQDVERDRLRYLERARQALPRSLWIFSDFYDLAAWASYCQSMVARGTHPKLVWIAAPEELDPPSSAAAELLDAETGERRRIDDPAEARREYLAQWRRHRERWIALAAQQRLPALELFDPASELEQLLRFDRGLAER